MQILGNENHKIIWGDAIEALRSGVEDESVNLIFADPPYKYEEHPTQKPVSLLSRIISASSRPGDIVLDPFSGTFTTSFVSQSLNRRSVGTP